MGGGKENLIDRAKCSLCAHARPEARFSGPRTIFRHRPLGGARPAPRAQEHRHLRCARGRQLLRRHPRLARSCQEHIWHKMGGPTGLRLGRGDRGHPSSSRRAAVSPKRHACHHQPESTCGRQAARPHTRPGVPLRPPTVILHQRDTRISRRQSP